MKMQGYRRAEIVPLPRPLGPLRLRWRVNWQSESMPEKSLLHFGTKTEAEIFVAQFMASPDPRFEIPTYQPRPRPRRRRPIRRRKRP